MTPKTLSDYLLVFAYFCIQCAEETIEQAVAAERERCAQVVERYELEAWEIPTVRKGFAAAIRRGGEEGQP